VIFAAIADWADSKTYTVAFMCLELGVSRAGYYAWRAGEISQRAKDDATMIALMRVLYAKARGNPGVPPAPGGPGRGRSPAVPQAGLAADEGCRPAGTASEGLEAHHDPWRAAGAGPGPDRPEFDAERANEKWCGDITYVRTWDGWAYVATVIDLFSRAIVGYAIADHMRTSLVTDALEMALTKRRPGPGVIFHADRGTQYTSKNFDTYCRENNIRRSLGRTGICYDNAVSESTFATYKKELIHTRPWPDLKTLEVETVDWIENYFNTVRRHSTLGYLTPREYELGFREISQLAA
jgi:putative transposase